MNGTQLARNILASTAERAQYFADQAGRAPCLATVLVGEDPASVTYVRMKQNRCKDAGVESRRVELRSDSTTDEVVAAVEALSVRAR